MNVIIPLFSGFNHHFDSSRRGPLAIEELTGVIRYRDLILLLIRRDVITRYKRSTLGLAWTMLNPLGTMVILTLVFSNIFHSISGYPVYILSGLIAWNFFSQTTTASLQQNVWGAALLHKIYLPRTCFTLSAIGTGVVNLCLSIVPLLIILAVTQFPLYPTLLFLPVSICLLAVFSLGIGLLFSTLSLFFPDVAEMYHVAITAWMYITPIIYPMDIIPEPFRHSLMTLNPMYYLIEIFRQPIYDGHLPSPELTAAGAGISLAALVVGWLVFSWKANEFTYRT